MTADWRQPYRSIDAGGGAETAGGVAWDWIGDVGLRARGRCSDGLSVEVTTAGDTHVIQLYRGTRLLACATIFRDPMNFAVLVRWLAEDML